LDYSVQSHGCIKPCYVGYKVIQRMCVTPKLHYKDYEIKIDQL